VFRAVVTQILELAGLVTPGSNIDATIAAIVAQ
jgi:hypothetical protein